MENLKMRYLVEPRDRIYVKRYGLLSFAHLEQKDMHS